jgi:hypothetical protein
MRQDISGIALNVLDHSDNRSNHNEQTDEVKRVDMFLPWHIGLQGHGCWVPIHAFVKEQGDENENPETHNLDNESREDDILTERLVLATAARQNSGSYVSHHQQSGSRSGWHR